MNRRQKKKRLKCADYGLPSFRAIRKMANAWKWFEREQKRKGKNVDDDLRNYMF